MRILQINNLHFKKGGAHNVYFNTAELLKVFNHEVFFYAMQSENMVHDKFSEFFPKSISHRDLSLFTKLKSVFPFIYNKEAKRKLSEYIKIIKPDVAHIHLFMGGLTVSVLEVLKENGIPLVHSVHDYRLICPSYLLLNGKNDICEKCINGNYYQCVTNKCSENNFSQSAILMLDAYYRKLYKNPHEFIDSLLFVSKFAFEKHIEFGIPKEVRAKVLYNFVPGLDKISPNHTKGKYFLYLGRLSREKGIKTLFEAAKRSNINLKVVGAGNLHEYVNSIKSDNIEILGFKSGKELIDLVTNSSYIIVPSEWYENNPMSIIEAYAYGKPVIGANIGGIPEIIEHGKTGFLFESGSVESLFEQIVIADQLTITEYGELSMNARKFSEIHFNPENYIVNLINIYKEIIHE